MKSDIIPPAFFPLLQAGLWEKDISLLPFGDVDFRAIYHLANQQTVVGLLAAGLDHVADIRLPDDTIVPFAGDAIDSERRNQAMNRFLRQLFTVFRNNGVHAILLRGQGVAQCYERPLWRGIGDIDLLLGPDDYRRAAKNLATRASSVSGEDHGRLHIALTFNPWVVELHGTLSLPLFPRVNKALRHIQDDLLRKDHVRLWDNDGVPIPLPAPDDDILVVFSHILGHFFNEGVGLRQVCDWCRLLYTHRDTLDRSLLRRRLTSMRLMSEWKTFSAFAVGSLAMPPDAMPFYSPDRKWERKASRLRSLILMYGNFGHNRDMGYMATAPFLKKKAISLHWMTLTSLRQLAIFPLDSLLAWFSKMAAAIVKALRLIR